MNVNVFVGTDSRSANRPPLRRITAWGVEYAQSFYDTVSALCAPDRYNLVLHKHLGDLVNTIAAKEAFEEKYGSKLRLIVRPQHEFLMRMFGVEDYATIDIDALVKTNKRLLNTYFNTIDPPRAALDSLENHLYQALFPCIPIKGVPFVCETSTNDFSAYDNYWAFRWAENLGLTPDFKLAFPSRVPSLSDEASKALASVAPLDKIVLFAPEAATAAEFRSDFWNIIADEVTARGYKIIVNSKRFDIPSGYSAFDLGLSLEDVVALGYSCASVFSVRSGLCDVLAGAGKRLFVFYPAMLRREMNGLNRVFAKNLGVHEIGIEAWEIDPVTWEGVDLTPALQGYVDGLYKKFKRVGLRARLATKTKRWRLLALRERLKNRAGSPHLYLQTNRYNLPRPFPIRLLGLPIGTRTFHKAQDGSVFERRAMFGGLIVIDEQYDGSWTSKLAGKSLSMSPGSRKEPTQRALDEIDSFEG